MAEKFAKIKILCHIAVDAEMIYNGTGRGHKKTYVLNLPERKRFTSSTLTITDNLIESAVLELKSP